LNKKGEKLELKKRGRKKSKNTKFWLF